MDLEICIATTGRKDTLSELIRYIKGDLGVSVPVWVSVASDRDYDPAVLDGYSDVKIVFSPKGSCAQRNAVIGRSNADILLFLDDDFLMAPEYIEETVHAFYREPDVVVMTGSLIKDGIIGPGIEFGEAKRLISQSSGAFQGYGDMTPVYNGYGCNMAVRLPVCKKHNICFDESLPLYGWLEDVDFSRQLAKFGRVVKSNALKGVHLGTKRSGRTPGKRLGYTQIANPIYLSSKGTVSWRVSLKLMSRNILANVVRSFRPEPWVDRRGRLKGNLLAVYDLLRGKLSPANIVDM